MICDNYNYDLFISESETDGETKYEINVANMLWDDTSNLVDLKYTKGDCLGYITMERGKPVMISYLGKQDEGNI